MSLAAIHQLAPALNGKRVQLTFLQRCEGPVSSNVDAFANPIFLLANSQIHVGFMSWSIVMWQLETSPYAIALVDRVDEHKHSKARRDVTIRRQMNAEVCRLRGHNNECLDKTVRVDGAMLSKR